MNTENACHNCHFYTSMGCATNPKYWQFYAALKRMDITTRKLCIPFAENCNEWKQEQTLTLSIDLSERKWQFIAELSTHSNPHLKDLIEAVRKQLNLEINDDYDDIPF